MSAAGGGGVRVGGGEVGGGSGFGARGGNWRRGDLEESWSRAGKGVFVKGGGRAREGKEKGARRAKFVSRGQRFQEFFAS